VQAARAFGVSNLNIMRRHILPNVTHVVLIVAVLDFSGLVLYEAVLSYVGVGVDPTTNSFGTMINSARTEMSRNPTVWWTLAAAFAFMVALVLSMQFFASAVNEAFDPRARAFRVAGRRPRRRRPERRRPPRSSRATEVPNVLSDVDVESLTTEIDSDGGLGPCRRCAVAQHRARRDVRARRRVGCGKSMTALSILRLLPDAGRVSVGAVNVEGTDILQLPEMRMRDIRGHRISIIFQEPSTSLNPVMTVGADHRSHRAHTPLRGAAAEAKAIDWLKRVGIPEPERRVGDYPFQMSGGQKQRVMIAIALAAEPDIVIADEPTTALDVTIQAQILDLLKELQSAQKMAMLLITHDLAIVAKMAHRVALMYAGQIVEVATRKTFSPVRCTPTRSTCSRRCPIPKNGAGASHRSRVRCLRSTRRSPAAASPIAAAT
jgi:ABC-type dipeptide/oligopeptide/nickel transport system ATPase subunit